ncbi:ras GTPase-activating protein-binding protein 1-like isoform X2 [Daphnia pulex]|uniref:ras GTPase-activating protein-binding protein 1-like isoform X2 n=1 Tax=Daphnia pulex TaxID=6669 RepID=UPI001EE0EBD2|nr:ras GTPase-activating protein-binding protein 1-like isoform X2 [Daphnia pulex]
MVMEAVPSPQCVGREFVRQYYTLLNKAPLHLHRFYNHDSSFVHGGLKERLPEEVHGQQQIHQKIMELDFHDCKAKILLVDSHRTLENGVVVQVSGELSNNGQPMRRFVQTFVLAPQSAKKYYVRNDIFRYQDDAFFDDEDGVEDRPVENENEVQQPRPAPVEVNHAPVAPAVVPQPTVQQTELTAGHAIGMNGTDQHVEEEIRQRTTPSVTTYTVPPVQQPEPVQQVSRPPKVVTPPTAVAAPPPPEKFEAAPEPVREPEPPSVPEPAPAPAKRAPETVAASNPSAPSEPKTFANLFKNPGAYNGTTTGLPSTVPPFGSVKSTTTTSSTSTAAPATAPVTQTNTESTSATTNVNGNDSFPAAGQTQPQRNNYQRSARPPAMGNGRTVSGPGSYNNRDRDQDRGERWSDNRAPSRDSTEEIGEWKQPNGDGYQREKDREFRRYDDNLQVFVGNIPHVTTEEALKELFERFGPVLDVRIHGKNGVRAAGGRAPLYAFVVFESPKAAEAALADKPMLNGDHRLNVEPKRRNGPPNSSGPRDGQRGGSMNRGGGMGGPGRGGRPMGSMGMGMNSGPPREGGNSGGGGGRGMGSGGGRGGYMPRRQ